MLLKWENKIFRGIFGVRYLLVLKNQSNMLFFLSHYFHLHVDIAFNCLLLDVILCVIFKFDGIILFKT